MIYWEKTINSMSKLNNILQKLLALAALFFILLFIYVSVSRINYPFELEWMEGGSVEHLERIMDGKSIYTPPSIEFIPYIYTPLYYYAALPIAKAVGTGLLPLRLVSFISTILLLVIIFLFVKRETSSGFYGLLAAGLFAASFRVGGAWFDLARVDMLYILLFTIALYLLRFKKSATYYFLAALIAGLSFLTKQTAALIFIPIGLYLLWKERKISWFFNITFALIVILSTAYFTTTTDGWYWFWNFTLPAEHHWNKKFLILFWTYDLIKPFSIAILGGIVFLVSTHKNNFNNYMYYLAVSIGILLTSWLSRLHYGGYSNVLIPAYLIFAILGTAGFKILFTDLKEQKTVLIPILTLAVLFQFTTLIYSPRNQIPTKEDLAAGKLLVNKIKKYHGDVYIPGNIYFARLAGKKVYTHGLLIWDLMQSNTKYGEIIENEFVTALKKHKFDAIIDYQGMNYPPLKKYYRIKEPAFNNEHVFIMRTGYSTRPKNIWIPKK